MKKLSCLLAVLILATKILIISSQVFAQTARDVDQWVNDLQNRKWQEREKAAYSLLALPASMKTDAVKKVLIDELEKEFDRIQKGDFDKCLNCDDGGSRGTTVGYLMLCQT